MKRKKALKQQLISSVIWLFLAASDFTHSFQKQDFIWFLLGAAVLVFAFIGLAEAYLLSQPEKVRWYDKIWGVHLTSNRRS